MPLDVFILAFSLQLNPMKRLSVHPHFADEDSKQSSPIYRARVRRSNFKVLLPNYSVTVIQQIFTECVLCARHPDRHWRYSREENKWSALPWWNLLLFHIYHVNLWSFACPTTTEEYLNCLWFFLPFKNITLCIYIQVSIYFIRRHFPEWEL